MKTRKHISNYNAKKIVNCIENDFKNVDDPQVLVLINYINLYYESKRKNKNFIKVDKHQISIFDQIDDKENINNLLDF